MTIKPGQEVPVRVSQSGEDTTEDDDRVNPEYLNGIEEAVQKAISAESDS